MAELLTDFDRGILTLTINRPEAHNTLSAEVTSGMQAALERDALDPDVRCVVLTSVGRAFCTGGDIGDQQSGANFSEGANPEEVRAATAKNFRSRLRIMELLYEVATPTIAVMPGAAAGSGLAFALACDFRFCLDTAKLTTAFAKLGLSGDSGISYFLPRVVGPAKAKELLFTADVLTGQEAYDIGLVTRVASSDSFDDEARAFARYVAELPTVALGFMKENLRSAHGASLSEVLDLETENLLSSMETEDHQHAAAAFIKKQRPSFEGR